MYVIGTTILVWGSFQDYQTNIWVPQTYKDPRIQTDFQAWCTATAKLVDRHRLLQESLIMNLIVNNRQHPQQHH